MIHFDGRVVHDATHLDDYADVRSCQTREATIWPNAADGMAQLVCFTASDILLTSHFVACDLNRRRAFLNQTYSGITDFSRPRFSVHDGRLLLDSEPEFRRGRHVVLGGPIDGVWYHWLFNWCPRLLLLRTLRPELLRDRDVTFVVHPLALEEPFRSVLDTFGLPRKRFLAWDGTRDLHLQEATLVSFPDRSKLYPDLLRQFADHLLHAFQISSQAPPHLRIFPSRQGLPAPKRRVHNFDAIDPVLQAFDIQAESLGERSARDQARLFHDAELIVGAHGSDLANLMFCRKGTPVIVIESQLSVDTAQDRGLVRVAETFGLDYHLFVADAVGQIAHPNWRASLHRDYVVDPDRLRARIGEVLGCGVRHPRDPSLSGLLHRLFRKRRPSPG